MRKIRILGISAYFHDSAVTLVEDGEIIYASQEERFSRIKHDSRFPKLALKDLLKFRQIKLKEIDFIVFFEKPFLKFERLIETYLTFAPRGLKQFLFSMPVWLKDKLFMKKEIIKQLKEIDSTFRADIYFSEHHLSHAASAFFPSPFEKALVLTADGVGEWATTSVAVGNLNKLQIKREMSFPSSLGLLYSSFTYYLGFKVNSGEYKLMGLAPYGKPIYSNKIKTELLDIKADGSFRLNQNYFDYATGFKMINNKFNDLFGNESRKPETEINEFHMNIASSIQKVTEEVIIKILKNLKNEYREDNLCLAGGVALNCVVNGLIKKMKIFKNIWIQPAAGDAGGSLGAALAFWNIHLKKKRVFNKVDQMKGSFLGPMYSEKTIKNSLDLVGANYKKIKRSEMVKFTAHQISKGKAVGWFQGRMEFGPRALGARSIIADPRNVDMQKQLNLKIKFRESFRPFAPAVIEEDCSNWFDLNTPSPYMLIVSDVKKSKLIKRKLAFKNLSSINHKRSVIPSVTHVDDSARIQTVNKKVNGVFFELLNEFKKITKTPLLINTSFNIRGEPIVCNPTDAFKCFMGTDLDLLVIENFVLEKSKQKRDLKKDYKFQFKLD